MKKQLFARREFMEIVFSMICFWSFCSLVVVI